MRSTAQYRVKDALAFADRKSTRLNSSHLGISYAVFCLKKKKTKRNRHIRLIADWNTSNGTPLRSQREARASHRHVGNHNHVLQPGIWLPSSSTHVLSVP